MLRNSSLDEVVAEARDVYASGRPNTRAIHEQACQHLPGGNTRTVLYHGPFPIRVKSGNGAYIEDVDGHRYLNLLGEYTAGVFGHSHPVIRKAIAEALEGGMNFGAHNTAEARLGALLTDRFTAIEQVRFTNSGTEANLMAVSMARHHTGRDKVMVMSGGYHGALLYFAGGGSPLNAPFPYVEGRYNDIDATRTLIREHANSLACILVEPMMGSSGCIPGDPDFLEMLGQEAATAGALLILDEVMTSRFGRGGAHGMFGLSPDLVTLGKWIGGGMSFGAFGGRADLMAMFDPSAQNALPHAGTFNNNVFSMHAGIAALTKAFTPDIAVDLHAAGDALRTRVNALFCEKGVGLCASGVGSLMNLHPIAGPVASPASLEDADDRVRELLFLDLLERGYYVARRGFIALTVAVTADELDGFVAALGDILDARKAVLPLRD
ncbi:MAG: aminotransferase class III-fold pyridoxal phosphate-dependent enzyme [Hyphomicrobiaceae bacterium]